MSGSVSVCLFRVVKHTTFLREPFETLGHVHLIQSSPISFHYHTDRYHPYSIYQSLTELSSGPRTSRKWFFHPLLKAHKVFSRLSCTIALLHVFICFPFFQPIARQFYQLDLENYYTTLKCIQEQLFTILYCSRTFSASTRPSRIFRLTVAGFCSH